jgi:hypothetical protein
MPPAIGSSVLFHIDATFLLLLLLLLLLLMPLLLP